MFIEFSILFESSVPPDNMTKNYEHCETIIIGQSKIDNTIMSTGVQCNLGRGKYFWSRSLFS